MKTYTHAGMPKGYLLIRYSLFHWGWKVPEEGYVTDNHFFTAGGAIDHAWEHEKLMKEEDDHD